MFALVTVGRRRLVLLSIVVTAKAIGKAVSAIVMTLTARVAYGLSTSELQMTITETAVILQSFSSNM